MYEGFFLKLEAFRVKIIVSVKVSFLYDFIRIEFRLFLVNHCNLSLRLHQ